MHAIMHPSATRTGTRAGRARGGTRRPRGVLSGDAHVSRDATIVHAIVARILQFSRILRSYFRIKNRFTRCDWDLVLHILFSGPGWLLPSCVLTMSPGSCGLRPLVQPARGHQHHGSRSSQHGLGPSLSIRSLGWAILLVRPPWAASTTKRRAELLADVNSAHDGHFLLILLLVLVLTNPEIPPAHFLYEASGVAIGSARAR